MCLPGHMYGSQKSDDSLMESALFTMWIVGIEPRLPGFVACASAETTSPCSPGCPEVVVLLLRPLTSE